MSEQRIPMFQGPSDPLPAVQKVTLGMENAPVEKFATSGRRTLEKTESIRVDQLQRQRFGQLGDSRGTLPSDPDIELGTIAPAPHPYRQRRLTGKPGEKRHLVAVVIDQRLELLGTKGTRHAEDMNPLEQRRLAAAVGTADQIDMRPGRHLERAQIAQPLKTQSIKRHGYSKLSAKDLTTISTEL